MLCCAIQSSNVARARFCDSPSHVTALRPPPSAAIPWVTRFPVQHGNGPGGWRGQQREGRARGLSSLSVRTDKTTYTWRDGMPFLCPEKSGRGQRPGNVRGRERERGRGLRVGIWGGGGVHRMSRKFLDMFVLCVAVWVLFCTLPLLLPLSTLSH